MAFITQKSRKIIPPKVLKFGHIFSVFLAIGHCSTSVAVPKNSPVFCAESRLVIAEETWQIANREGIDYCGLLLNALKGKSGSIYMLTMVPTDAAATLGHGAVLNQLIEKIGEEKFIAAFKGKSNSVFPQIRRVLEAGIEFSASGLGPKKELSQKFPKISSFFNSDLETTSRNQNYLCDALCVYQVRGAYRRISLQSVDKSQSDAWQKLKNSCHEIRDATNTKAESNSMLQAADGKAKVPGEEYSLRIATSDKECRLH